jgi:GTP cyclohydrolase I
MHIPSSNNGETVENEYHEIDNSNLDPDNSVTDRPQKPVTDVPIKGPLPDIALEESAHIASKIDWVGMTNIESMLQMEKSDGQPVWMPALASAYVNIHDADAKGIHMSRLYLTVHDELQRESYSPSVAKRILTRFVESHHETSDAAEIRIKFTYACQREAIKSKNLGWRHYPVEIISTLQTDDNGRAKIDHCLKVSVDYSSTCPCSSALSRQLLQEKFIGDFDHHRWLSVAQVNDWLRNHGSTATPHSQRSTAAVEIVLDSDVDRFPILNLIDDVEAAVGTPVQAAVKRVDEQEFARVNGENLMFCEDAARQIREALEARDRITDYRIRVDHFESLHPHDATAMIVKGIDGGLRPQ